MIGRDDVPLAIVCLVVFVSLMGAGIVVPLFPFFGARVGASPAAITQLVAAFSLGQLISTPFWGWLSDRIGRRPVFLMSLTGAAFAYILLGTADSVGMLLFSRIVGGLASGIGAVAFAAAADLSRGEDRARAIGRVGAAAAFGFIVGPALGGLLAGSDPASADYLVIALVAGSLDLVAMALAWKLLPETHPVEARVGASRGIGADGLPRAVVTAAPLMKLLRDPLLWRMNLIGLLGAGGMAVLDSTFPLFANRALGLSPREIGLMFGAMAGTNALLQAVAVGPAMNRFGARTCLLASVSIYGAGCLVVAVSHTVPVLMAGMLVLAVGYALFTPPASQLVSNEVGPADRGAALGIFQGAGNIGRFLTPLVSGAMFTAFGMGSPFLGAAVLMVPALLLILGLSRYRGS